jgi:hypothetical protein
MGTDERTNQPVTSGTDPQAPKVPQGCVGRFSWAAKPVRGCLIVCVLAMGGCFALARFLEASHEEVERATLAAQPVVDALERFRQDKGDYPQALEELVPRYLAGIPAGLVFNYTREPVWGEPKARPTYELRIANIGFVTFLCYWPEDAATAASIHGCMQVINGWCWFTT